MKNFRRLKRKILANHLNSLRLFLIALILITTYFLSTTLQSAFSQSRVYGLAAGFYNFVFTPSEGIESFNQRTNVLLLGKAGEGNSAPDLTDTIMLISFDHGSANSIEVISIPRDIWDADLQDKINAAYKIGNEKTDSGGLILAKSKVSEILGIPVHYAILVDFNSFKEVIDIIGGVEITVDKSFVDEKYPILGKENDDCNGDIDLRCRYETLQFIAGKQFMDSETALKYARSRQSTDPEEGNDLARARRQQKVLDAIRSKVFSTQTLFAPSKVYSLWQVGLNNTITDINEKEAAILARRILQSKDNISSYVIPEEFLFNPPISSDYNYLYVFVANRDDGSWTDLHNWVSTVLK